MTARTQGEATVEVLTGIALVAAAGVFFFTGRLFDPLSVLLFGAILLASAVYQRAHGWHVARSTWALGAALALIGLGFRLLPEGAPRVNWLGLVLLVVVAWWVYHMFFKKR